MSCSSGTWGHRALYSIIVYFHCELRRVVNHDVTYLLPLVFLHEPWVPYNSAVVYNRELSSFIRRWFLRGSTPVDLTKTLSIYIQFYGKKKNCCGKARGERENAKFNDRRSRLSYLGIMLSRMMSDKTQRQALWGEDGAYLVVWCCE